MLAYFAVAAFVGILIGFGLSYWLLQPRKTEVPEESAGPFTQARYRHLHKNYNDLISEASELMRKSERAGRYEKEINNIRSLQRMLLPESDQQIGSYQAAAYFHSATECSGDWWHVSETDGKMWIWIGDVTGHGAAQALMANTAKAIVAFATRYQNNSIEKAARQLNAIFHDIYHGQFFMTAFAVEIDMTSGRSRYVNCGHESPLLFRRHETALGFELLSEGAPSTPLGLDSDVTYRAYEFELNRDDVLFLYSDGFVDLYRGLRFRKTVKEIEKHLMAARSLGEFRDRLGRISNLLIENVDIEDDISFVAIQRS